MNDKRTFSVAILGFSEGEQRVLRSVFSLSSTRNPSFTSYAFSREVAADIVIVDADNPRAVNGWDAYRRVHAGTSQMPVVMMARKRPEEPGAYFLPRPIMATRLLALLEQVANEALGYQPVLAIAPEEENTDTSLTDIRESKDKAVTEKAASGNGGVSALVVDDSLPVRIQMKMALEKLAAHVDFAETGEDAFKLLEDNDYNLVFLDVILPGVDGYEICKAIKQDPKKSETPVIMLTSNSSPGDRVKGKLAGCDTYLIKPVRSSVFEEVVREYLP